MEHKLYSKAHNRVLAFTIGYFVLVTYNLIVLLGNTYITSIHLLSFVGSFYFIGYMMINDFFKEGMFSIRLLFNAFGILYTNYYIIECLSYNISPRENEFYAMELSYLAIITFNIFYGVSKKESSNITKTKSSIYNINLITIGLIFLFLVSVLAEYYVVVYKVGLILYIGASRAEQSLLRSDYSIFLFYQHTIPLVSSVSFFLYLKYKRKTNLILFILSFLISTLSAVITASRSDMLAIVLPLLFLCNYFRIITNKITIVLAVGGFALFGIWKSLYTDSIEVQYDSEFVSWYKICNNILNDANGFFLYGKSYFNTIINLIIPVTGIESLSTWYVRKYEFDVFSSGGGRGFSSVLEAYMNFHIFGIVLIYGFYGWVSKKLNTKTDLNIIIYMIVLVSLNMLFRSEAYAFWKNMAWFRIYPVIFLFYISRKKIRVIPQVAA